MSPPIVIEIVCEGPTDFEVLRAMLLNYCQVPADSKFLYKQVRTLLGKRLWDKVEMARFQATVSKYSACIFVLDTDGNTKLLNDMIRGRDVRSGLPMPVGVAHPCIEAWLLVDATAIKRGLDLIQRPVVPSEPESIATADEAKSQLASYSTQKVKELAVTQKAAIAMYINWSSVVQICPSFTAFDEELTIHVSPLFAIPSSPAPSADDTAP